MVRRANLGVRSTWCTIALLVCFLAGSAVAQAPTPVPLAGFAKCDVALPSSAKPIAMAADDFNADGRADLAVLDQTNNQVVVLLTNPQAFANGNCAGATTASMVSLRGTPSAIAAGVLDTTGVVDLVVAIPSAPGVSILRNNGSGSFTPDTSLVSTGTDPEAVAIADIDGDGRPDIVVGSGSDKSVTVLYGQKTGGFVLSSGISVDVSVAFLLVEDFNNDGFLDIAAGSDVYSQVSILLQQRSVPPTFEPVRSFVAGEAPTSMVAGDFNNDGAVDLAVTRGDSTLGVFLNDGSGGFPDVPDATANTGSGPVAIVADHFNPDVNLDVAVATQGDSAVTFYLGNGTGAMTEFPNACGLPGVTLGPCLTGGGPVAMVLGDVDGDRRDDVITANQDPASVTVLLSSRPAATPTFTSTPTGTATGTATPTATPTDTPTGTPTPTSTPTPTPTRTTRPTFTFTISPTPAAQCIGGICVQGQGCRIGGNAKLTDAGSWWGLPALMFWLLRRQSSRPVSP